MILSWIRSNEAAANTIISREERFELIFIIFNGVLVYEDNEHQTDCHSSRHRPVNNSGPALAEGEGANEAMDKAVSAFEKSGGELGCW